MDVEYGFRQCKQELGWTEVGLISPWMKRKCREMRSLVRVSEKRSHTDGANLHDVSFRNSNQSR
jgi:hypothetical protein